MAAFDKLRHLELREALSGKMPLATFRERIAARFILARKDSPLQIYRLEGSIRVRLETRELLLLEVL